MTTWRVYLGALLLVFTVSIFHFILISAAQAEGGVDCGCEVFECGSCEDQQGLSFYTAKCDGGQRVKSCSRPKCVPKDPMPASCPAFAATGEDSSNSKVQTRIPAAVKETDIETVYRETASFPVAGTIDITKGSVWILDDKGERREIQTGDEVRKMDTLKTGKNSQAKLVFKDGNTLQLSPETEITIKTFDYAPSAGTQKTLLNLIKGRVRSKVNKKYEGANYYQIKTRTAVAGVRGTDFVITYKSTDEGAGRQITRIETLEGKVQLADPIGNQEVMVGAGEHASYVVASNDSSVFGQDEINDFVKKGYMTPVYKLSENEIRNIKWETEIRADKKVERGVASGGNLDWICAQPKGQLNQCAWTCEKNPRGESRCRTDLPEVNCVRRRCNANGSWKEPTRIPASFYDRCDANKVKVGPCDY